MSLCKACDQRLVLRVVSDNGDDDYDDDDDAPSSALDTIPDDLQLRCDCHFHWQCLMDEASAIALSLKCPSCNTHLPVNEAGPSTANSYLRTPSGVAILARYANEGGVQDDLDILPIITEEAYLESNPDTRPARALQVMCSEGDVAGMVELLQDAGHQAGQVQSLLHYQDPLSAMKTALHIAVESRQDEPLWLLLWLFSTLPNVAFPQAARQAAESMGVGRLSVGPEADLRLLRDAHGRTAGDVAQQLQGSWSALVEAGILSP